MLPGGSSVIQKTVAKIKIIPYALIWLCIMGILSVVAFHIRNSVRMEHTAIKQSSSAEHFHLTILENVRRNRKALHTLVESPVVRKSLQNIHRDTTIVNPILQATASYLDASIVYIMDSLGQVVASSTYDGNKTLYGNRYPFRPYFQLAMQGNGILYPALGVTTKQKGLYYSEPIIDSIGDVIGVAVVKSNTGVLQRRINEQPDPALMVSPEGVVFATNRKDLEYALLRSLSPEEIRSIEASRQFGDQKLHNSTLNLAKTSGIYANITYTLFAREITDDGWSIVLCQDRNNLEPLAPAEKRIFGFSLIFVMVLLSLLMVLHVNMRLRFSAQNEFSAIFNSTVQSMVILSTEGVILKMNEAALSFKKRVHDDFTGSHFSQISWWDKSSCSEEMIQREIQKALEGETTHFEAQLYSSRDEQREFDISIKPFYDKDMRVIMLIVEARDITTIKKISRDLHTMEQHLRAVIDAMPSMFICLDPSGKITSWNREAELLSGIAAKDALGQLLSDLLPELPKRIPSLMETLHSTGSKKFQRIPLAFRGMNFVTNVTLYHVQEESVDTVVVRIDDITESTLIEEKLQQSQKMDAVGQLAGGIAHDFNNLLTGIMGAVELFKMDDMERPFLIDIISSAVKSGSELTHKLLNFSRTESKRERECSIHDAILDAIRILKASLDSRITIANTLKATQDTLVGSMGELQNIFINLGINASHAMNGNGTIHIETSNQFFSENQCKQFSSFMREGNHIIIKVTDSGHGIPDEHKDKVFEPFFTTKDEGKGTGLGLATALAIVNRLHGTIQIDSVVGNGTTFSIYLPILNKARETEQEHLSELRETVSGTILLIDDDSLVRFTTGELLRSLGYTVILADDIENALQSFQEKSDSIDVILIPDYRAMEELPRFVMEKTSISLLITTEDVTTLNQKKLLEMGANDFIEKPFSAETLHEIIEKQLGE